MTPDCNESERLGSTTSGEEVLYIRGEDVYCVPFGWDDHNHKLYKLCWPSVSYWNGPQLGRRLSEEEKRLIIERTAVLLRERGAEVIIEEPEKIEARIPDSSHVFAQAAPAPTNPWWKFW